MKKLAKQPLGHLSKESFDKEINYVKEADLLTDTKEYLELISTKYALEIMRITDFSSLGYSDIFLCVNGLFVAIELKAYKGIQKPHQKVFIQRIINCNGIAGFCYNLYDVRFLIRKILPV